MLLWDTKAGAHNRTGITLVGGTIATAEDTLEATTMVMVLHLF